MWAPGGQTHSHCSYFPCVLMKLLIRCQRLQIKGSVMNLRRSHALWKIWDALLRVFALSDLTQSKPLEHDTWQYPSTALHSFHQIHASNPLMRLQYSNWVVIWVGICVSLCTKWEKKMISPEYLSQRTVFFFYFTHHFFFSQCILAFWDLPYK